MADGEATGARVGDVHIVGDEAERLQALSASIRDQDDLERNIGRQADQLLREQADQADNKRLEKTQRDKTRLENSIRVLQKKLTEFGNHATKSKYRAEIEHYQAQIKTLDQDLRQISNRVNDRNAEQNDDVSQIEGSSSRLPGESRREFLIRTGKITPFSKIGTQLLRNHSDPNDDHIATEEIAESEVDDEEAQESNLPPGPTSHRNLLAPGFDHFEFNQTTSATDDVESDNASTASSQYDRISYEKRPRRKRPSIQHMTTLSIGENDTSEVPSNIDHTDSNVAVSQDLQDAALESERAQQTPRLPVVSKATGALGQVETSESTNPIEQVDSDAALARRLQDEEEALARPRKRNRHTTQQMPYIEQKHQLTSEGSPKVKQLASQPEGDIELPGSGDESEFQDEMLINKLSLKRRRPRERERLPIRTRSEKDGDDVFSPLESVHSDSDEQPALATTRGTSRRKRSKRSTKAGASEEESEDLTGIDDGNENVYQARLQSWIKRRRAARMQHEARQDGEVVPSQDKRHGEDEGDNEPEPEWSRPHPSRPDAEFENGFRIPGDIYPALFDYQKTGVRWLWELYSQKVGGIVGDEMGLGKTIQIIAFLAGLHYCDKLSKPVLVVCPATVMKQWVNEFHRWWPPLRVSILHSSGSGMFNAHREEKFEFDMASVTHSRRNMPKGGSKAARNIVDTVKREGHVLVTSYSGLQTYSDLLTPTEWEYAVLDEGHSIRNPNAAVTIACKELRTHNRIILSGTPMQNNLTELWSLFDFVFPMRLGTLFSFKTQFEIPIKQGGYANASNLAVETARQCAETLKDTISPYLLQRFKIDVATDLPKKTERVLFCRLTKQQQDAYVSFLNSESMRKIMDGKKNALAGIDHLRKICNHPDLLAHEELSRQPEYNYGRGSLSGKMQVVKELLQIFQQNGHKTLLFAQHRIMLDILEKFVGKRMAGMKYRRMDGTTSIKDRQDLVDEFNANPDIHVFLLTTKVGGLGVNLTGADRVIIFDPDWNPSTDVQARERSWRLGQKREVQIFRLLTAGTIEEKIYHRQLFKQFLTNKILRDPKQRQTFKFSNLQDLFTLGDFEGETETSHMFKGSEVNLSGSSHKKNGKGAEPEAQSLPTPPEDAAKANEGVAIQDIYGIDHQEDFQGGDDEDEDEHNNSDSKADRMLSSIFAGGGVHSAIEHDSIFIQREATKFAAQSARELQRAGEIARTIPAGVPTWTGQFGSTGRPPSPPRPPSRRGGLAGTSGRGGRGGGSRRGAGPSSAALLDHLRARQAGVVAPAGHTPPSARTSTMPWSSRR